MIPPQCPGLPTAMLTAVIARPPIARDGNGGAPTVLLMPLPGGVET